MTISAYQKPGLLVSVRSIDEAQAALEGGADIVDIKEPAKGPLGKADDETITAIAKVVDGRCPVSAAMGELIDTLGVTSMNSNKVATSFTGNSATPPPIPALSYIKWGLAGYGPNFPSHIFDSLTPRPAPISSPQTVIVAYADWQCAQAPDLDAVIAYACKRRGNIVLLDTHCKSPATLTKNRPTLLDWLSVHEAISICAHCRDMGVRIALAGSLTLVEIKRLLKAKPDWFAVRGAVCRDGDRLGLMDAGKIRELTTCLRTNS